MTTIIHYSRSHKRRVLPPAMAAQPLQPRLLAQVAPALATLAPTIVVHRQLEPANLHIPAPLLPRAPQDPAPAPRPSLADRLRDAWNRLPKSLPDYTPAPAPAYTGLAWALR